MEGNQIKLIMRGSEFSIDADHVPFSVSDQVISSSLSGDESQSTRVLTLNRNPNIYQYIADYNVTGRLHLPEGYCGEHLKEELEFWGVDENRVAPCCVLKLRTAEETSRGVARLSAVYSDDSSEDAHLTGLRKTLWTILEQPNKSTIGKVLCGIQIFVIVMSIILLSLMSIPRYRNFSVPRYNVTDDVGLDDIDVNEERAGPSHLRRVDTTVKRPGNDFTIWDMLRYSQPVTWLIVADICALGWLTLVFILRLIVCPARTVFFANPLTVLEGAGTVLQWVPCIAPLLPILKHSSDPDINTIFTVLSVFKLTRLFPFVRMLRHYRSIRLMLIAIQESRRELMFLVLAIHMAAVFFGYALYLAEFRSKITMVPDVPTAIWWGVITMTTVGYGDVYPTSPAGKYVGLGCAVTGILIMALPVPIIAANFYRIHQTAQIANFHRLATSEKKNELESETKQCLMSDNTNTMSSMV